jgi:hypothetical protein
VKQKNEQSKWRKKMSYCQLLGFTKDGYEVIEEFKNAHGWTAFVWDCLWGEYVPKKHPYDSWISGDPNRLWKLHNSTKLEDFERFVLKATFDTALVKQDSTDNFMVSLQKFVDKYQDNATNRVCHIPKLIELLSIKANTNHYIAIGWYGMSIADNCWDEYGGEDANGDNIIIEYNVTTGDRHFFVNSDIEKEE